MEPPVPIGRSMSSIGRLWNLVAKEFAILSFRFLWPPTTLPPESAPWWHCYLDGLHSAAFIFKFQATASFESSFSSHVALQHFCSETFDRRAAKPLFNSPQGLLIKFSNYRTAGPTNKSRKRENALRVCAKTVKQFLCVHGGFPETRLLKTKATSTWPFLISNYLRPSEHVGGKEPTHWLECI